MWYRTAQANCCILMRFRCNRPSCRTSTRRCGAEQSYEQAKISSEIARYGEEQSQLSVAYLAEYNYWNLASNEALLAIATRYEGSCNMYNVVRTRFDDGYVAKTTC